MRHRSLAALVLLLAGGCSAPGGGRSTASSAPSSPASRPSQGSRSTTDARVRSFRGQVPPEIAPDARWLGAPSSSLAALRGRVVYVQFAFPT